MRYRKLDELGDYVFGNQQADFYIDSADGVAQAVKTRLALYTGEWFLDTTDGTPWRTEVLGKYTMAGYDAVIKDRILSTQILTSKNVIADAVTEIVSYTSVFDPDARKLTVTVTINTIYGQTMTATTI